MDVRICLILSSIILFILLPFRISGTATFSSAKMMLDLTVFFNKINLVNTSFAILDGKLIKKSKRKPPTLVKLRPNLQNMGRARFALKPKSLTVCALICNENPYLAAAGVSCAAETARAFLRVRDINLNCKVLPMVGPGKVDALLNCTFRTNILKIISSFISA